MTPAERDKARQVAEKVTAAADRAHDLDTAADMDACDLTVNRAHAARMSLVGLAKQHAVKLSRAVLAFVPPGDAQPPAGWTVTAMIRDRVVVSLEGRGYDDLRTADARLLALSILSACDRADAATEAR